VLIGEENYHLFDRTELKYTNWEDAGEKLFDTHYGWMVEVDPFDPDWPPRKHTAMGRMRHENAALTVSRETGRVVAYMGEDREDRFIFKFVTKGAYQPDQREENKNLFSEGAIFVAGFDRETAQGKWIPLTLEEPRLAERFEDEAELLVHLSEAASLLLDHPKQVERSRTIPFSRPEDLEIHPLDGSVYAALTGNPAGGDFFGEIVRLVEQGDPAVSKFFTLERFAAGGLPDGFVNPDNLFFDSRGNLWVAEDMSPYALNRGFYRKHGNNGLFMIPTAGPLKGRPFRFATAPNGAEFSGPWFTPDEKTLFLSVQHPGETTYLPEDSTEEPVWTSHWPPDNDPRPRPGVIAIQGF
jgi:secreted PhoX family phosphatase